MGSQKFKVEDVVTALQNSSGLVYVAARQLGCSANTVYNYAKRYPQVQEAIDGERGLLIDTAELALVRAVERGEAWAVSLVLKTIGKARGYTETTRTEVTGADGGELTIRFVPPRDHADTD